MNIYYPQFGEEFSDLIEVLKGKKVVILGHLRPDGDCIGSQVALTRCFMALGIEAMAISPDPVPRTLRPFLNDTPVYAAEQIECEEAEAVYVDCADPVRIGKVLQGHYGKPFLNIDHHVSNRMYGLHNFIHAESSATAEILAGLFLDRDLPIDPVTAQALYVGIATDTGQFRFPSTTRRVFQICCRLTELGANPAQAAYELYERESIGKIQLLRIFLSSLQFECGGKVCVGFLKNGVYSETGADKSESEGLVDYTRAIEGVEIGILVEEGVGSIKGSFRSNDPIHRVDRLAEQFNGGGHACAAGFNCRDSLAHFYPRLLVSLERHFQTLAAS